MNCTGFNGNRNGFTGFIGIVLVLMETVLVLLVIRIELVLMETVMVLLVIRIELVLMETVMFLLVLFELYWF